MATKKIENLEETTNLSDQDLLFISKSNGNGYDSKNVTLASIAEYVKNSIGETIISRGGPVIFDTSEDARNDYLFNYELPYDEPFDKTVQHNCMVVIGGVPEWTAYDPDGSMHAPYNITMKLDNIDLSPRMLFSNNRPFFMKSGQRLRIPANTYVNNNLWVNIIPIKSGGVFIDTTKPAEAYVNEELLVRNDEITVDYPSIIIGSIPQQLGTEYYAKNGNGSSTGILQCKITLNGVDVIPCRNNNGNGMDINNRPNAIREMFVEAGDRVILLNANDYWGQTYQGVDNTNVNGHYCIYPIITDASSSDSGSETDLNVQLIDNYDSNEIDLEIVESPTNATITYATSSSYDVSNVELWTSVSNNKATITFSPQTNMDKKYVYFKVSNNGSESKYMMQLMQSYYETQSSETTYDIRIAKIAYSGNGTSGFSGKSQAESTLLSYLPSMTGKGYTLYNTQTQEWVAPENINSSNVSQFVFNHRVNGSYYYWSYKVSVPQTSSETYTYLHSIILPLTSIDN